MGRCVLWESNATANTAPYGEGGILSVFSGELERSVDLKGRFACSIEPLITMRLATLLPRAARRPLAVVGASDGTWIGLHELAGRRCGGLGLALPWFGRHRARLAEQGVPWGGRMYDAEGGQLLVPLR